MRFRNTLFLFILLLAVGAYIYFVEQPRQEAAAKKTTLLEADIEDVTSVQLTYPDREVALVKDGDQWKMTKPVETRGDESAMKNIVNSVVTCEVTRELEDPSSDLKTYGLDTPFATITLGLKDGKQLPKVRFGNTTPVGASAYAKRDGEQAVLLTSSTCRTAVDKQIKDLRDKTLVEFEDDDVQGFQIERPGDVVSVERKDGSWKISPGDFAADSNTVRTYLSSMRTVRAVEFPDDQPGDLSVYGLDSPRLRVRIRLSGSEERTIEFGDELANKSSYVRVGDRPGVYEVGEYTYRNLDKTPRDLRDKTVLPFDVDSLQSIDVTRKDGGQYRIVRSGDTWTVEGLDGTPKPDALHEYVGDVHDLKGFEIIADDPEELASYGLDSPRLRIVLAGEDGELGTILLGQIPNDEGLDMTAMAEGGSTIYKVRSYIFTRLNRDPASLVDAPKPASAPAGEASASEAAGSS